jgi:hypothetical protein
MNNISGAVTEFNDFVRFRFVQWELKSNSKWVLHCPVNEYVIVAIELDGVPEVVFTCFAFRPALRCISPHPHRPRTLTGAPSAMGDGGCCDDCGYWWNNDGKYCLACIAIVVGVSLFAVLLAAFSFVQHIHIAIEDTSLTRFDLVTSPVTAFAYNLTLTLTVHNPNWAMGLKNTKPLEAAYMFDDQQLDRVQLAEKVDKHPPRKTRVYHLVRNPNNSFVALGNAGEVEYRKEKATGTF